MTLLKSVTKFNETSHTAVSMLEFLNTLVFNANSPTFFEEVDWVFDLTVCSNQETMPAIVVLLTNLLFVVDEKCRQKVATSLMENPLISAVVNHLDEAVDKTSVLELIINLIQSLYDNFSVVTCLVVKMQLFTRLEKLLTCSTTHT